MTGDRGRVAVRREQDVAVRRKPVAVGKARDETEVHYNSLELQRPVANPDESVTRNILALQQSYGNSAVRRLIQTKRAVGPPGDSRVQVADRMMGQSATQWPIIVQRKRTSDSPLPSPRQVTLVFVPDEVLEFQPDAAGNMRALPKGIIHVKVKGKEVGRFDARGGPPRRMKDTRNPGHFFAPTPPGRFKLGAGTRVKTDKWPFSQIAWGTPLRERDTPQGKVVEFKRGGAWESTMTLTRPLSRERILDVEEALGRSRAIPSAWDLNDFGKLAFRVRGTQSFVHTAAESTTLTFSHGCIHLTPSDRDLMVSRGYLRAGVTIIVKRWRDRSKWGTAP